MDTGFRRNQKGPPIPQGFLRLRGRPDLCRRRWGLGLLLCFLLTACLSVPPFPEPSPAPTLSPAPLPTWTPVPAPGPPVTALTLWVPEDLNPYGEGPGAALLAQRLMAFGETYPDRQVQVIVKKSRGRGGVLDFLRTAHAAAPSVLPDLVVLDLGDFQVAAQSGLLRRMDPWLQAGGGGAIPAGDLYPFALEMGKVGGEVYGIPLFADLDHLAYRPAQVPEPPATWASVLAAPAPLLFPALGADGADDFTLAQYLAAGGRLTDDAGRPVVDEGPLAAVLEFYAQAVEAGVVSPETVLSLPDAQACWERFLAGEGGMTVVDAHRFWAGEVGEGIEPASFPTPDGRPIALAGGSVVGLVTDDPERQRAAMGLVAWLLEPGWYGEWTRATGHLPVVRGGLEAWRVSGERRAVLAALLESAQCRPPAPVRSRVGSAIQRAVEAVLTGQMSPRQAAAQAAR